LLLALLYLVYIYVRTRMNPELAPALPDDVGPVGRKAMTIMVFRSFIPPILLIMFVLGSIFAGWATPTEAAGVGALGAVLLALANRKLNFKVLKDVSERSALTIAMIFGIFIGATCFSYVYRSLGGDDLVHQFVAHMGLTSWGLLFLMMGMVFVLGFFFDWIEITLIVLPLFAPMMRTMDFGDHIPFAVDIVPWIAILLAVNLQTSFLTPPFGFALFYMKGVAPATVKMQQIYRGIIPFVSLQLLGLGAVIIFPALALWLPRMALD
jgi:tripartite ATP-independent transporter DctM subunit